eukprot:CAMPEP_0172656800 /NCGR_PEP_ID=MMETSP1074-20121228/1621_1 /TAXON_ID=2916 /ORGANISM="Ceratium fusus, Strain PA161109" /LENGTH=74 /DNA_ID=CAMNT_0013471721 /DNA_START=243 /DNA_END=467 /DNA_ORIENTATION=+
MVMRPAMNRPPTAGVGVPSLLATKAAPPPMAPTENVACTSVSHGLRCFEDAHLDDGLDAHLAHHLAGRADARPD